jgi:DNA repair protein RadC
MREPTDPAPTLRTLQPQDRPREKLARIGATSLSDHELVALVLAVGTRRAGALALAASVLKATGGLRGLARAGAAQLSHVSGLGPARAARLLAAVELGRRALWRSSEERPQFATPADVAHWLLPQYGARPAEQFGVVLLDTKNRLLKVSVVSLGSLDASVVLPRDVFREAALNGAACLVLFHNHPSGDPTPSKDDLAITKRLSAAGQLMGIAVLDHVILGDGRYFSFRESDLCGTDVNRGLSRETPGAWPVDAGSSGGPVTPFGPEASVPEKTK